MLQKLLLSVKYFCPNEQPSQLVSNPCIYDLLATLQLRSVVVSAHCIVSVMSGYCSCLVSELCVQYIAWYAYNQKVCDMSMAVRCLCKTFWMSKHFYDDLKVMKAQCHNIVKMLSWHCHDVMTMPWHCEITSTTNDNHMAIKFLIIATQSNKE